MKDTYWNSNFEVVVKCAMKLDYLFTTFYELISCHELFDMSFSFVE